MARDQAKATLSTLPQDIHDLIAPFLHPLDVLALSLTCKGIRDSFFRHLLNRVALDGPLQLINFIKSSFQDDFAEMGRTCRFGHPIPHPQVTENISSCTLHAPTIKREGKSRASHIRHLELYEPGPRRLDFETLNIEIETRLQSLHEKRSDKASSHVLPILGSAGLIASVIQFTPNLKHLHIYQSSFALTPPLAIAISTWTPSLVSLHFHSIHTDTSSVAFVVEKCRRLEEVDFSGVKSCACRGKEGAARSARDLGVALRRNVNLKRVVIRASRAACEGGGILLRELAREEVSEYRLTCPGTAPHQALSTLKSLELHRLGIPASALIEYLCSPASSSLSHLFLGGLQKVHASHLIKAIDDVGDRRPCFFTRTTPLHLEIDACLLSLPLLKKMGKRIVCLRIYQPSDEILSSAIRLNYLTNLVTLIILPTQEDIECWYSERGCKRKALDSLTAEYLPCLDVRIGDEQWKAAWEEKRLSKANQAQSQRQDELDEKQLAQIASSGDL